MKGRAVFLDRDGTINFDPGYVSSPDELYIFPASRKGLKLLREKGFLLFVVSNQSGLARGLFTRKDLEAIHQRLEEELRQEGIRIEEIVFCPHHPDDGCDCRKPSPRLVYEIAKRYDIDLSRSFFVGDKPIDVLTGYNAGCRTVLLADATQILRFREDPEWKEPDYVEGDLYQAALLISNLV